MGILQRGASEFVEMFVGVLPHIKKKARRCAAVGILQRRASLLHRNLKMQHGNLKMQHGFRKIQWGRGGHHYLRAPATRQSCTGQCARRSRVRELTFGF